MFRFQWEEKYSVGVKDIDENNKHFLMLINDLHLSMIQGKGKIKSSKIIQSLIEYADTTFSFEERYMSSVGMQDIKVHKEDHTYFIETMKVFLAKADNPRLGLPMDIMRFLKSWIEGHLLVEDKKYLITK